MALTSQLLVAVGQIMETILCFARLQFYKSVGLFLWERWAYNELNLDRGISYKQMFPTVKPLPKKLAD